MTIELNHTIVHCRDKQASARWYEDLLGVDASKPFGPFLVMELDNGVSLDLMDHGAGDIGSQHYAFLVSEDAFDSIFARIQDRGLDYWADPGHREAGQINTNDGGRGVYWDDPDGHILEIITRPYGSGD